MEVLEVEQLEELDVVHGPDDRGHSGQLRGLGRPEPPMAGADLVALRVRTDQERRAHPVGLHARDQLVELRRVEVTARVQR